MFSKKILVVAFCISSLTVLSLRAQQLSQPSRGRRWPSLVEIIYQELTAKK